MDLLEQSDVAGFEALEARIRKVVETIKRLRDERQAAVDEAEAARRDRDEALRKLGELEGGQRELSKEIEVLRRERQEVRQRIERLLGQIETIESS